MKRKFLVVGTVVALASSIMFSSCIGSFGLTKSLLTWNQGIDNKFVNWIIFVLISPAYAFTATADLLVLNSIEFWSGSNPIQAGIIKEVKGKDGKMYTIETLENGYKIQNEAGELAYFIHNAETDSWSSVVNGVETKLLKFEQGNFATVFMPNGEEKKVELSEDGVIAFQQMMNNDVFLAAR